MDALSTVYFMAFAVGGGLQVATWLLGRGRRSGRAARARAPTRMGGRAGRLLAPLFDMQSLAVLACAGGGSGYIARALGASAAVSAAVALITGLTAAYFVGSFLRWLERGSRYQEAIAIEGTVAVVLRGIAGGRTGEVVYTREGARRFLAAKSESGRAIEAGTEVIILRMERGIAEVAPTPELFGEVIGHG